MTIQIYFHIFANYNPICHSILQEQIECILNSPIYDKISRINLCVSGSDNYNFNSILTYLRNLPDKFFIRKSEFGDNTYERYTLLTMKEDLQNFSGNDDCILYIHTKGITRHVKHLEPIRDWRRCMMYFLLNKGEQCLEYLKDYDTVGIFKHPTYDKPHYSGNFWWARGSYLKKLFDNFVIDDDHLSPEMFLFKANPKYFNMHEMPLNYFGYSDMYPPEKYQDKQDYTCNSAWIGHEKFALWLVNEMKPETIVELGVDEGFSTYYFSKLNIGKVYGIDSFEGDVHTGFKNTYNQVTNMKDTYKLDNLELIKGYFNEVAKTWDKKIDILHIDGRHYYQDIREDYTIWSQFVKDDGIILLHDTCVYYNNFGVYKFFDEISLPKLNFTHSYGLGIITKNINLLNKIKQVWFTS